jgi:magnesium chelatase subunit I
MRKAIMDIEEFEQTGERDDESETGAPVRSLRELIERVSGKGVAWTDREGDAGLAEHLPYPFVAVVGQTEMKLALLMGLINPHINGVLLIGPRGTGKSSAVRGLTDLLPQVSRSLCYYGCLPEDIESDGMDAVCPECARKFGQDEPLAVADAVRLIELPLNARLDDVIGSLDERSAIHERMRLRRGILALADRNLLYVDEVNLLGNEIIDCILESAAQGSYTVRRGMLAATYRSRFVLIGAMNPEEGQLRPQIMDRFGLRVYVRGLRGENALQDRIEAYRRVKAYREIPRRMIAQFSEETARLKEEIQAARDLLPKVAVPNQAAHLGAKLIAHLEIDSLRAEHTLFEAARAYAAMDGREEICRGDIIAVAPMALRLRRSTFIKEYFSGSDVEEQELAAALENALEEVE